MRTQKVFFRRTRRGNVSLVASEQYLRDDLPCGLSSCRACEQEAAVLDGTRPVLVLEAGVLEAQLDLFRDGLFGNCVVPLSALAALEASGGGGQLAREARATIATEGRTRGLFVFGDSHHAQVQAGRAAGESVAKWRQREAEAVAAWYRSHAPSATVLLVTDAEA
jgi:exosome complex exonuclease DIS3/RRP44